jgi:hypothetical protein
MAALLKPLEQFVCDTCGEIIHSPDEGYVEWIEDLQDRPARGFRIVHHARKSPRSPGGKCYQYEQVEGRSDLSLRDFVGPRGVVTLLAFIDAGEIDPNYSGPQVRDLREWTELARRLLIPYYEEARLHWGDARESGFFAGANEVSPYMPEHLQALIDQFGGGD